MDKKWWIFYGSCGAIVLLLLSAVLVLGLSGRKTPAEQSQTTGTTSQTESTEPTVTQPEEANTIRYDSGDVYQGEILNGVPHGKGVMQYANGDVYEGQWEQGIWMGEGVFRWHTGETFSGAFTDVLKGTGTLDYGNGARFEGSVENGAPIGEGVIVYPDGTQYSGGVDGHFVWKGQGSYTYADGSVFSGEMTGEGQGTGQIAYAGGSVYTGPVEALAPKGEGKQVYPDGGVYIGGFSGHNTWQGKGQYRYPTGELFQGVMTGEGKGIGAIYYGHQIYEGPVEALAPKGIGKLTYEDGGVYQGGMQGHNTWFGDGVYTYPNGAVFTGTMRAEGCGVGTIDYGGGHKYEGPVEALAPKGNGKLTYGDGGVYQGEMLGHNVWCGQGVYTYPTKEMLTGVFTAEGVGEGVLDYKNGNVYTGSIQALTPSGQGELVYGNGIRYQGGFEGHNCWKGDGKVSWPTGEILEGTFHSEGNGEGTYVTAQGAAFQVDLQNWLLLGNGRIDYANGEYYEGSYTFGAGGEQVWYGSGSYTYANGAVFTGTMTGIGNGTGTIDYGGGHKYEGPVVNLAPWGQGRLTYGNGICYEGGFTGHNSWTGEGKVSWPTGETLTGIFTAEGNGSGTYVAADGQEYPARLENWLLIFTGRMDYPNGEFYEGEYCFDAGGNPVWYGSGTYHFQNGITFTGIFTNVLQIVNPSQGTVKWPGGETFVGTFTAIGTGTGVFTDANGSVNAKMENWVLSPL